MNELDQFVKHTLRAKYYIRYMDDFIILHPSKKALQQALQDIERFCSEKIHLQLHPKKTVIRKFHCRERFVGYDLAPFNRHLAKPTVKRFMRRIERAQRTKDVSAVRDTWQQFEAYAGFAHCEQLLRSISPFSNNRGDG